MMRPKVKTKTVHISLEAGSGQLQDLDIVAETATAAIAEFLRHCGEEAGSHGVNSSLGGEG